MQPELLITNAQKRSIENPIEAKLALSLGFSLVEGYMLTFREEKGHPFQVIAFPKPHLPQPPSKPVYNSKDKPLDQEFPENHQMCVIFANI